MGNIGEIAALTTAVCWAFTAYIFTNAIKKVGAVQVNIDRVIISSVFMLIIVPFFGIDMRMSFNQFFFLVASAFLGLVFGDVFLFKAYSTIGARLGVMMMSLAPVLSTILAFLFLKELIELLKIIGMALTIVGVLLAVSGKTNKINEKTNVNYKGILFGLLGALGQASGLIFVKYAFQTGELDGIAASFVRLSSAALIFIVLSSSFKNYKNPFTLYKSSRLILRNITVGSFIGSVVGITLSLISVQYTSVGIASTLMATTPIVMLPIAHYYFKEKLDWKAPLGSVLAVTGTAIIFLA